MSEQEIIKDIETDTDLKQYEQFYDHAKGRSLDSVTDGTKLSPVALSLNVAWKAASNAMRLPWVVVLGIDGWAQGFSRERSFPAKFTGALSESLADSVPELKPIQKMHLVARVHEISGGVQKSLKIANKAIDRNEIWGTFIDPNSPSGAEFRLAIWGSQMIGYSAIYHAYENFIRESLGILEDDDDFQSKNIDNLKKFVLKHFGQDIVDHCLFNSQMNLIRSVRNALAHGGGKVPDNFNSGGISVVDKQLHIQPNDTRKLMHYLQDCAIQFSTKGVTLTGLK